MTSFEQRAGGLASVRAPLPFVSIITVSLNSAETIADTLDSVSMQHTDTRIEHICVDGGSTDGTRRVIDRRKVESNLIRTIYEPDHGIYDAMNKGLHAARGEYVLFLNADDFLVSATALETAMKDLTPGAPENPDLVVGDVSMGTLGRLGVWRHRRVPRSLDRRRGYGLFPVHQGCFSKRELLLAVGGFETSARLASDITQFYDLELLFRPRFRIVQEDVAFMRAGGAANGSLGALLRGTGEIYRHLRLTRGRLRALGMITVKTLQSLREIRFGRCTQDRWFAA